MRRHLLLLPLLAATACATGPGLESRMASYTGASAQTLVQDLGVPDKQITVNGTQYLAYVRQREDIEPGINAIGGFGPLYGGPFWQPYYGDQVFNVAGSSSVVLWRCETTFALQHGKVVSFTLRGNDCS